MRGRLILWSHLRKKKLLEIWMCILYAVGRAHKHFLKPIYSRPVPAMRNHGAPVRGGILTGGHQAVT